MSLEPFQMTLPIGEVSHSAVQRALRDAVTKAYGPSAAPIRWAIVATVGDGWVVEGILERLPAQQPGM